MAVGFVGLGHTWDDDLDDADAEVDRIQEWAVVPVAVALMLVVIAWMLLASATIEER